jgi:hypothetical protein
MTFKIDHVKGATTHHTPVQIGGPAPTATAAPAPRELPPIVAGTLRRLGLTAPPAGQKLRVRDVDAAMARSGMAMPARMRAKSELAFYGVIQA